MAKFILKRAVMMVITVFLIATLTFFLMHTVPGGPFNTEKSNPKVVQAMERKYGLDKPLMTQYGIYMGNLVRGDLGDSLKRIGMSVNRIIADKFPVSASLGIVAVLLSVCVGVPLGSFAALNRNKKTDRIIMFICTLGYAIPSFVMGALLLLLFGQTLGWLPFIGLDTPLHYIMPAFALSLSPICFITRLMRSSMLDVLGQDYIKTARAKGLPEKVVLFKHAMRNSIIPVVTYLGPLTAAILTGGFVIERLFTVPGLGKFFIDSINNRDYPLIMGVTVFYSFVLIAANFIVDMLYGLIDPRIKYE